MIQNKIDRTTLKYVDGDFTVPAAITPEKVTFPFEGDTENYLMEQDYMVYSDYYIESMPKVGDSHPDYSGLFYIKDTAQKILEGGAVMTFTRQYGQLPGFNKSSNKTRVEAESYVWTKPGINTIDDNHIFWYIDNSSNTNPTTSSVKLYTNIKNGSDRWVHDVTSQYDYAFVNYGMTDQSTGQWKYHFYQSQVLDRGEDWIEVTKVPYSNSGVEVDIWYDYFCRPRFKINPIQTVVNSTVEYDYWLPGLNCDSIDDISLPEPWTIYDAVGNVTDIITEDSTPTLQAYNALVTAHTKIQVENATLKRWQGPIFERAIRYIKMV